MKILEKLAGLKADVQDSGGRFVISVYDTDNEGQESIMWMNCNYNSSNLYVEVINFDDNLFFALPKKKQDSCSLILLKKFMTYYKEHFGKDSGQWLPVNAEFLNYRLQEMVEKGIQDGVFPKTSLMFSKLTTEEKWNKEPLGNMDNRKLTEQFKNDPASFFPDLTIDSKGFIENTPISTIISSITNWVNQYPVFMKQYGGYMKQLDGYISNNLVFTRAPFTEYDISQVGVEFTYYDDRKLLYIHEYLDEVTDLTDPNVINTIFAEATQFKDYYTEDQAVTKDEFLAALAKNQQVTASRLKRRVIAMKK